MIDFTPLASSSAGCAYLVRSEGHQPLLIDCGLPFTDLQRLLWSEGVSVSDLAGCLISHGHGDHCKAAPKLMAAGVDCYASAETVRSEAWPLVKGHRTKVLASGRDFGKIDKWFIGWFPTVHDDPGAVGFDIREEDQDIGGYVLYLTDSAYCPFRFEGLTHICVEANYSEEILKENVMAGQLNVEVAKRTLQTHASIETVIKMLKANDLSRVDAIWLLHLSDGNSNAEDFRSRVQAATGCPTYVAPKRKE